jgi:hypothetical protein
LAHWSLQATIRFSTKGKIIYDFPYRTSDHPGKNKAKIVIAFDSITGMQADGDSLLFQLSKPPRTFVGQNKLRNVSRSCMIRTPVPPDALLPGSLRPTHCKPRPYLTSC